MTKVKVGQMAIYVQRNEGENATWEYLVAKNVFDNMADFRGEYGTIYMHAFEDHELNGSDILKDQVPDATFNLLFNNNNPVIAKKKLFGDYTFEPKTK